jgi:hypothetical protein
VALTYVGGTSGQGTGSSYTVSLNDTLTGGSDSSPSAGDIVVVISAFGATASSAPTITGNTFGSYTPAHNALYANDTWDVNYRAFYAVMGSTPDTQITATRTSSAAYGGATVVQVWRGVDPANPLDVTSTTATAGNASRPNPPSITPTTSGAIIIAGGAGTQGTTGAAFTVFSGMSNGISVKSDGTTADIGVLMASFAWTSGAYDPAAATGATTSTSAAWAASTLALRPFPDPISGTLDATEGTSDTASVTGKVLVQGTLSASETGSDTLAVSGKVIVTGTLSVTEEGSDTLSIDGSAVKDPSGSLSLLEEPDTISLTGKVLVTGSLSVTEAGQDSFEATGTVLVSGILNATETGSDELSIIVTFTRTGSLFAVEPSADTMAINGKVLVSGTLAISEGSSDRLWIDIKNRLLASPIVATVNLTSGPAYSSTEGVFGNPINGTSNQMSPQQTPSSETTFSRPFIPTSSL